jgi:transcriptional regulator with PAS, ATPase and Fis domain
MPGKRTFADHEHEIIRKFYPNRKVKVSTLCSALNCSGKTLYRQIEALGLQRRHPEKDLAA